MTLPLIEVTLLSTPIGALTVCEGPEGLVGIEFGALGDDDLMARLRRRIGPCNLTKGMSPSAAAVAGYFGGKLMGIQLLRVSGAMGTPFQRQVWAALRRIPAGKTTTYGALATMLGRPQAMRAVGAANGDNPVPIVVPCHRVIGADGSLVGYGGGIERKRWLLKHEGAILL